MNAIITITENPAMPGSFTIAVESLSLSFNGLRAGHDPSAAAARAMQAVCDLRGADYTIFAPKKVLEHIPVDLRHRRS